MLLKSNQITKILLASSLVSKINSASLHSISPKSKSERDDALPLSTALLQILKDEVKWTRHSHDLVEEETPQEVLPEEVHAESLHENREHVQDPSISSQG